MFMCDKLLGPERFCAHIQQLAAKASRYFAAHCGLRGEEPQYSLRASERVHNLHIHYSRTKHPAPRRRYPSSPHIL